MNHDPILNSEPQLRDEAQRPDTTKLGGDAICIIGMHRSGTSMIAKLLQQAGLYLGPEKQLLGPDAANPDGHFEHKGFLKINRELLQYLGAAWQFPPQGQLNWQDNAALEPLRADARALIAELSARRPWGWKEPRTTVLLPFWKSIAPGLRFVLCIRSPLEVAKSLTKRNNIPLEQGIFLWHRYTRAALEDSEGCSRLIVHYEDFFSDPGGEIDRLVAFCGLKRPENLSAMDPGVRIDLRHQRSELAEFLRLNSIPVEHKFLYLGLRGLLRNRPAGAGPDGEPAQALSELLWLLDEFKNEERMAQLQGELAQAKNEISRLRAEMWNDLKANHRWAYRTYRNFIRPFRVR